MGIRSYIQQALQSTVYYGSNVNRSITSPIVTRGDELFNYTSLLLDGDGTNGTQNNTFLDSSSNNFTITRNGNTTQGTLSPFGDNWSNYFDGSGDYLSLPNDVNLRPGTSDFTMETWIYRTGASGGNAGGNTTILGSQWSGGSPSGGWIFYLDSNYKFNFAIWNTGIVQSTSTINIGQWYHIAVTRSGSTNRLFINGFLEATSTNSSDANNSVYSILIGRYNDPSGFDGYFNGYLSNLRFVKGSAVYTSAFTPPTEPLTAVANTALLTCQSNRFRDNSTNNFTITRNGDVGVEKFNPFGRSTAYDSGTDGGSGYFDGTGDYLTIANNTAFNLSGTTYTIEGWINPNGDYSNFRTIIAKRSGDTVATNSWDVFLRIGTGVLGFWNGNIYLSSVTPAANAWNYFAAVFDGTNINLYLNGSRVLQTAITNADTNATIYIGSYPTYDESFIGYISGLRITKGSALYSGTTMTVPTAPLTSSANTSLLLNFTNAAIRDNTGLNNLETVGNAQISTTQSKFGGSSLYFDGTGDRIIAPPSPNVAFGTGDFTIEFWLYSQDVSNTTQRGIFQSSDTIGGLKTTYTSGVLIAQGVGGGGSGLNAGIGANIAGTFIGSSTGVLTTNTWYHIALVRSSGTATIYVNGTSVASGTASGNCTGQNACIGGYYDTSYLYIGYLDELRITKGIARYTANFTPPTREFASIFGSDPEDNTILASGGTIVDSGSYRNHIFTSPGSFTVLKGASSEVEYLVVGGGGGGGTGAFASANGGGGGAGGFRTGTNFPITRITYPITVGGGGAADAQGNPSIFSTITSTGGGYGGGTTASIGGSGGSGGGGRTVAGGPYAGGSGNTPPVSPSQGNPGGVSNLGFPYQGGGGGGAGEAGNTDGLGTGGDGSPITWIPASYGTPGTNPGRYFAGGGSGGEDSSNIAGGEGGGGSGGRGAPAVSGSTGTTNTGGGGGGGASGPPAIPGLAGGSGIVVIRYPI